MLVSHLHRFIYLKTVKTAGTSVEVFLEPYCVAPGHVPKEGRPAESSAHGIVGERSGHPLLAEWFNHMPASRVRAAVGEDVWTGYSKICCVRNPFSKVVSWFHFWVARNDPAIRGLLESGMTAPQVFRLWLTGPTPHVPFDRHVYTLNGRIVADHVLRFEHLVDDLALACRALKLPDTDLARLGHFKKPEPRRTQVAEYYDDSAIEVVTTLFDFEFSHLGYDRTPERM